MAQIAIPATDLDEVTMIQNLQHQIIEMRGFEHKGPGGYDFIGDIFSPYLTEILAQPCTGNFKMPTVLPYDERTDPNFHFQHYETWMSLQGLPDTALCHAFNLTLIGLGFE